MGGAFNKNAKVILVGLDNSGKSTILHWLKQSVDEDTTKEPFIAPTVGF